MKALVLVCSILAVGCSTTSKYDEQWEKEKAFTLSQTVAPSCPSTYTHQCGLLSDLPENAPALYIKENCGGKITAKCAEEYSTMMNAKYILRYPQADVENIFIQCKADPKACQTSKLIEMKMMQSHNERVFKLGELRKAELENDAARDRHERSKAIQDAFKGVSQPAQGSGPVSCTKMGDNLFCR